MERRQKEEKPLPFCPFPEITDVWVNLHDHTALGEQQVNTLERAWTPKTVEPHASLGRLLRYPLQDEAFTSPAARSVG